MENQKEGDIKGGSLAEKQVEPIATRPVTSEKVKEPLIYWLYISRSLISDHQSQEEGTVRCADALPRASLRDVILSVEPIGSWDISETRCGLIAGFAREIDVDKLLQQGDLATVFHCSIQVARFCDRDTRYKQAVLLRDVPHAIPLQDLNSALARQGITAGSVERLRHYVRVELLDAGQYEQLLCQGLDFFGAARFCAVPERWTRSYNLNTTSNWYTPAGEVIGRPNQQLTNDDVLQCYRCQGFWHVAANCRHLPRCVRCGELHSVEFCSRPRNNPVCCHCDGPHHAGYRQCPVRLQLANATMVSLTLSANRLNSSTSLDQALFSCSKTSANNFTNGNNVTATSTTTNQKPN